MAVAAAAVAAVAAAAAVVALAQAAAEEGVELLPVAVAAAAPSPLKRGGEMQGSDWGKLLRAVGSCGLCVCVCIENVYFYVKGYLTNG